MNQLYFGDNLHSLREALLDETVDLIYLDPPFNSTRDYNLLFKSPKGQQSEAQITAFEDSWHWSEQAEREFDELVHRRTRNAWDTRELAALETYQAVLMPGLKLVISPPARPATKRPRRRKP